MKKIFLVISFIYLLYPAKAQDTLSYYLTDPGAINDTVWYYNPHVKHIKSMAELGSIEIADTLREPEGYLFTPSPMTGDYIGLALKEKQGFAVWTLATNCTFSSDTFIDVNNIGNKELVLQTVNNDGHVGTYGGSFNSYFSTQVWDLDSKTLLLYTDNYSEGSIIEKVVQEWDLDCIDKLEEWDTAFYIVEEKLMGDQSPEIDKQYYEGYELVFVKGTISFRELKENYEWDGESEYEYTGDVTVYELKKDYLLRKDPWKKP